MSAVKLPSLIKITSIMADLLDLPLIGPPVGITPNFVDSETRINDVYHTAAVCISLISVFATVRIYAEKSGIMQRKGWGDTIFLCSVIGTILFISMILIAGSDNTWGKHAWNLRYEDFGKVQLVFFLLTETLYSFFLFLVKLSLFVLYLEVFGRIAWLRWASYAGIGLLGSFSIACIFVYGISCGPKPNAQSAVDYVEALGGLNCAHTMPLVLIQGIVNVLSDMYLMVLPVPVVWSLQLAIKKKIGLSAMFLIGVCAVAASSYALHGRVILVRYREDSTWTVVPVWIGALIEMTAGVIICCMPATMAVLRHTKTRVRRRISSGQLRCLVSQSIHTNSSDNKAPNEWPSQKTLNHSGKFQAFPVEDTHGVRAWSEAGSPLSCIDHGLKDCIPCGDQSSHHLFIRKTTEVEIVTLEV